MSKYLYGASIQGIQSYIFKTNRLQEIVGASQLVDQVCQLGFFKKLGIEFKEDDILLSAAGNFKCKVDENTARKLVRNYPKKVVEIAPGVTVSQAVVKFDDEKKNIHELEKKLRAQRNKPMMPFDMGYMGLNRARKTGFVAYDDKKGDIIDKSTAKKIADGNDTLALFRKFVSVEEAKAKGISKLRDVVPFDLEDIVPNEGKSWIAIIHADGNSIGKVIKNLEIPIKKFSKGLQEATLAAAKQAFDNVVEGERNGGRYPFRPVVLGGDDLTVIIRADLAYDFTKEYLQAFENETASNEKLSFLNKKLTACAGIAYIKKSYPFHYGVHLAESLVKEAKKASKEIDKETPPSSLSFYKVQSSFTEELKEMRKRTHTAAASNIDFNYGPYFLESDKGHSVKELDDKLKVLEKYKDDDSKGVSKLRQWISELYQDKSRADFMLSRMSTINKDFYSEMHLENEKDKPKSIIADVLHLHGFK